MERSGGDVGVGNGLVELAISAVLFFGIGMVMMDEIFRQRYPSEGREKFDPGWETHGSSSDDDWRIMAKVVEGCQLIHLKEGCFWRSCIVLLAAGK